jgi:hypothetical protein
MYEALATLAEEHAELEKRLAEPTCTQTRRSAVGCRSGTPS